MEQYIPKHPFRERIYNKFYKLIRDYTNDILSNEDIQKMALNIEKGLFNYTINKCDSNNVIWNDNFKNIYVSKVVTIYDNLNPLGNIQNKNLMNRLLNREFNEFELSYLKPEEIFPEKYQQLRSTFVEDDSHVTPSVKIEDIPDGMHRCGYCASQKKPAYKTTYYQLQTRSAKLIGLKSTLLITSWLCYWKNSYSPSIILKC